MYFFKLDACLRLRPLEPAINAEGDELPGEACRCTTGKWVH